MAWMLTPTPGDRALCAKPCQHTDCAQHRKEAAANCYICGQPIGHGSKVTRWGEDDERCPPLVHFRCALLDIATGGDE